MSTLGAKLRSARHQRQWSLEYVASQVGVSFQSVWKWESDIVVPRTGALLALTELFHVTLEYLTGNGKTHSAIDPHEFLNERIKRLRLARKLTQKQLSERLGYHYLTISQWETGAREPSSVALGAIARELGVSTDYLLRGRDSALLGALKAQIKQHAPYDRLLAMVSVYD